MIMGADGSAGIAKCRCWFWKYICAVAPTGRRVAGTGIAVFRLADGGIAEVWANWDQLGLLQQIGALPAPEQAVG